MSRIKSNQREVPQDLRNALRKFLDGAKAIVDYQQALLFGSRARGDARPDSDVDVALIAYGLPEDAYDLSMRLADWSAEVLLETGYVITPVLISGEDWDAPDRYTNPIFLKNIKREGVFL